MGTLTIFGWPTLSQLYLVGLITLGNRVKPSQTDNKKYFMTTALEATDKNFEKMMQMLSPAQ
jgi:hypothetical protein